MTTENVTETLNSTVVVHNTTEPVEIINLIAVNNSLTAVTITAESLFSGDRSKIAFLILLVLIFLLCAILVGMLIAMKKKYVRIVYYCKPVLFIFFCFRKNDCRKNMVYSASASLSIKAPNDQQKSNNDSVFIPYNDDSTAHLLLNSSVNVQAAKPVIIRTEVHHEIYEDITLLDSHEDNKLNENVYIDDPTGKNFYCYIKVTNDMVSGGQCSADSASDLPPSVPQSEPPVTPNVNFEVNTTPKSNRQFPLSLQTSTPNTAINLNYNNDNGDDYYRVPLNNNPV
jgi:hypothetical protein